MRKYAAFSDRYNGPIKYLAEDLRVNRYFVIQEGRYAYQDHGKFHYENGETATAHRVWTGLWPKGIYNLQEVAAHIEKAIALAPPKSKGKKGGQNKFRNNRTAAGRGNTTGGKSAEVKGSNPDTAGAGGAR